VNRDPFAPREAPGIGDPVSLCVRERVHADVLSGRFRPGARIRIADVSRHYPGEPTALRPPDACPTYTVGRLAHVPTT
jgi:hypothetical protein